MESLTEIDSVDDIMAIRTGFLVVIGDLKSKTSPLAKAAGIACLLRTPCFFKQVIATIQDTPDCLFATNHLDWRKGWAIITLDRSHNYGYYYKYRGLQDIPAKKKIKWMIIRPVNGLSNRLRFLMSTLALGHQMKFRCFLNWTTSEGFDSTEFCSLFDANFLQRYDLIEIGPFQFQLLSSYALILESHIPGILNGLQQVDNYSCHLRPATVSGSNLVSVTGSNNLVYVFQHATQFTVLNRDLENRIDNYLLHLKPTLAVTTSLDTDIDTTRTYGLHIRRGETLNFAISKLGYFVQIAHAILESEPLARFFISTNHQPTLKFLARYLPSESLIIRDKPFLETVDWNSSYLKSCRPEGSSREALADLWLLSRCKKVYGTHDSSFSIMAALWGKSSYHPVTGHSFSQLYNRFCPGWSLVTCCMNRLRNLFLNLPSWLACDWISEIVIIDWSSDVDLRANLREQGFDSPKIRCYRVEGQTSWVLTWAYNLGILLSRYERVVKVDCDIFLGEDFFSANQGFTELNKGAFYTGDWQNSNQIHLNGQLVVRKVDFLKVNGYNEFIVKYGYDDTDLYERLTRSGLRKIKFIDNYEGRTLIHHRDHTDNDRICHQRVDANELHELIENNRILSGKMQWTRHTARHRYLIDEHERSVIII